MPWKNQKRGRRGSSRSWGIPPRVAAALKRKAQKTTDRVLLYDGLCGPASSEYVACVTDPETLETTSQGISATLFTPQGPALPFVLQLLEPQEDRVAGQVLYPLGLEEYYLTKITGYVDMVPRFQSWKHLEATPLFTCQQALSTDFLDGFEVRAGLLKAEWEHDGEFWEVPEANPLDPEQWSDRAWLKRWDRSWMRSLSQEQHGMCCDQSFFFGETSGALVSGSGAIATDATWEIVEDIDGIDCEGSVSTGVTVKYGPTPKVRLSLNMKRRLKMNPAEGLALYIAYTNGNKAAGYSAPDYFSKAVGWTVNPFIEVTVER